MSALSFFRKKTFFSTDEYTRIVEAIRVAENETSGEIRVYIEQKNPITYPIKRAHTIFYKLRMQETMHRNAVLIYIATQPRSLTLFADEGIYKSYSSEYWNNAVADIIKKITETNICDGIVECIERIGQLLKEKFPYTVSIEKNELPDEIVFGK